ncbi:twin-arginine translocation pathway signal protein [Rhodospirillum rubrum]|uniref:LPS assembly lipoprotein LptE n=1 Tax=Rhodospirillum rubrum TaxID=1085 RepID=UPI001904ADCF|nr:LPS assembly lipoprotein LptE [Rhodospirillum rubrum]MBK1663236.1 twin-arginine translocation pathway signal protein [Rhodospirillum rubrum]MBK1676203.1 twin-arginine translocation pathway signal protein [Rhodospirillum rubrum]
MSWSRRQALVLLAGALVPAGCGFRPMLADRAGPAGRGGASGALAGIYVHSVTYSKEEDARFGQEIRNALIDRLGLPDQPTYGLTLAGSLIRRSSGITKDDRTTRYTMSASITFQLRALDRAGVQPPKPLLAGTETSWAAYDVIGSPFANEMNERDAVSRTAEQIADQLYTRLGAYFSQAPAPAGRVL